MHGQRFGEIAIEMGLARPDAVAAALETQAALRRAGLRRQIGGILVEREQLRAADVPAILARQGKEIRRCEGCGCQSTADVDEPLDQYRCGACGGACVRAPVSGRIEDDRTEVGVGAATTESTPAAALLGRVVGGLRLSEVLGEGGMGVVFRAEHTLMERRSAVKILPAALTMDRDRARRFLREAALMARVSHPNVVAVRNVGEDDGLHFIEMELVVGETLADRLAREGRLPLDAAVPLMRGVAAGLEAAHRAGVVHRDVKPSNVLLDAARGDAEGGAVRLVDFGLARAHHESGSLTATGAVLGTPEYMSPEQCRGTPAGPPADVYGFGVTFYRVLTGRLPFEAGTAMELVQRHLHADPAPPIAVLPALPRSWSNLIERCLAKDPHERFADGAALAAAIATIERGEFLAYVSAQRRRRRRRLLAAAAGVLATMAAGWGLTAAVAGLRAPAVAPPAERAAAHVARAENLLRAGDLWAARSELREAVAAVAEHPEARPLLDLVNAAGEVRAAIRSDRLGRVKACTV